MAAAGTIEQRHGAIRAALAHRHGREPGAGAIAVATLGLWREVAAGMAPMIGVRGFEALFSRSLHLTTQAHPWLGLALAHEDCASVDSLAARLEAGDPRSAQEASAALLVTFTDLLAVMIGASLTDRLLNPIWAPIPSPSAQETRPRANE